MQELTEPELNRNERLTRDYILPLFPSTYGEPVEQSDEKLRIVKSILAKQYVEHADLSEFWKTGVMLLAYDLLFLLDSQIYGLVLVLLGSIRLRLPALFTPEILAENAFDKSYTLMSEIESKAKQSVNTNVGVVALAVGFIWQIFTISGPIPIELLSENHLQGIVPNWLGFVSILTLGYLILAGGIADLRKRI